MYEVTLKHLTDNRTFHFDDWRGDKTDLVFFEYSPDWEIVEAKYVRPKNKTDIRKRKKLDLFQ